MNEAEEFPLDEVLPKLVHHLLEPMRGDKRALARASNEAFDALVQQIEQGLKNAAAGRGLRVAGDEWRDVVESALKHEVEDLLDHERVVKRKSATLVNFLEEDIHHVLVEASRRALEEKARNARAVELIANEASLSINQLLGNAKRELANEPDPDVHQTLREKIEALDMEWAGPVVDAKLRAALGIDFLEGLRERLHHLILEKLARFKGGQAAVVVAAEELGHATDGEITKAIASAARIFADPKIHEAVLTDVRALREFYADREALAAKFAPYVHEG